MNFVHDKNERQRKTSDVKTKALVKCRICKAEHWTTMCAYKDSFGSFRNITEGSQMDSGGCQNRVDKLHDSCQPVTSMSGSYGEYVGDGPRVVFQGSRYNPPVKRG